MTPSSAARTGAHLATGLAVLGVAAAVASLVINARTAAFLGTSSELYLIDVWISVLLPPVGAYLIVRERAILLGWLFTATALTGVGQFGGIYGTHAHVTGTDLPLADLLTWLATWSWTPYLVVLTIVPMIYPDGPRSDRYRLGAQVIGVLIVMVAVLSAVAPGPLEAFELLDNPFGITSAAWAMDVAGVLIGVVLMAGLPAGVISMVLVWRDTTGAGRRRIGRVLVAVALLAVCVVTSDLWPYPFNDVVPAAALTIVIIAMAAATTAQRTDNEQRLVHERLALTREAERFRLYRDLHDGIGPELAGLSLQLSALKRTMPDDIASSRIADVENRMRTLAGEVRRIVADLRPPSLDQLGLAGALAERAATLSESSGVAIEIDASVETLQLSPAVEVAAFRIATEAMTNVIRHSEATHCTVSLYSDGSESGALAVRVDDNGVGFGDGRGGGHGLDTMRTRAEELGGWFRLSSRETGGSTAYAVLPLT